MEHLNKEREEEAKIMKDVSANTLACGAHSDCRFVPPVVCPSSTATTRAYCVLMKTPLNHPLPAQVPGWKVGEPTTRRRWLPPLESWDKRPLV